MERTRLDGSRRIVIHSNFREERGRLLRGKMPSKEPIALQILFAGAGQIHRIQPLKHLRIVEPDFVKALQ